MPIRKLNQEKLRDILVLLIVSQELPRKRVLVPYGEETWPTSWDISQPKPWTLPSRIPTEIGSAHSTQRLRRLSTSSDLCSQEELLEPPHCSLSTHWISLEPDWLLILDQEDKDNSTELLIVWRRSPLLMVSEVSIKDSSSQFGVSSSTEESTSECSILLMVSSNWKIRDSLLSTLLPKPLLPWLVLPHIHLIPSEEEWWCNLVVEKSSILDLLIVLRKSIKRKVDISHSSRVHFPTFSEELVVLSSWFSMKKSKTSLKRNSPEDPSIII